MKREKERERKKERGGGKESERVKELSTVRVLNPHGGAYPKINTLPY